jgi:hypothetical protein
MSVTRPTKRPAGAQTTTAAPPPQVAQLAIKSLDMRRDGPHKRVRIVAVIRCRRGGEQRLAQLHWLHVPDALLRVDDQHAAARIALALSGQERRRQLH